MRLSIQCNTSLHDNTIYSKGHEMINYPDERFKLAIDRVLGYPFESETAKKAVNNILELSIEDQIEVFCAITNYRDMMEHCDTASEIKQESRLNWPAVVSV